MRSQVLSTDWSIKGDIDEDYESFVSKILHCAKLAARHFPKIEDSRVSNSMKELLEKRRTMKREGKRNVEYSVLCKLIRRKLKEDLESFRRRKMIESAKRKKGLKECRKGSALI